MASETEKLNGKLEVDDGQSTNYDFHENKRLRDAGLEYISRTGKTVAAKVQPEELCNCPQRCGDKIPDEVRKYLFTEFYKMGDHIQQNNFLQKYIEMRSVRKRLWDDDEQRVGGRLQRRVSCKYHVPTEIPKDVSKDENNPADNSKSDDKTQTNARKLNTKHKLNTVEVCQKAFMNTYAITEKRIRLQREKLITKSRKDAGVMSPTTKETSQFWAHDLIAELGPLLMNREILANISSCENLSSLPSDVPNKILHAIDNDISLVNNFFGNQLWRPEYIDCDFDNKSFSSSENNDDYFRLLALRNNKSNGDSPLQDLTTPKSVSTDKPTLVATLKYVTPNTVTPISAPINKAITYSNTNKNVDAVATTKNSIDTIPSTPKNLRIADITSKTSGSGNPKHKLDTKYISFENSSISITPVTSKNVSNSTSSSIYNSINFGNSSISITPLYRQ